MNVREYMTISHFESNSSYTVRKLECNPTNFVQNISCSDLVCTNKSSIYLNVIFNLNLINSGYIHCFIDYIFVLKHNISTKPTLPMELKFTLSKNINQNNF